MSKLKFGLDYLLCTECNENKSVGIWLPEKKCSREESIETKIIRTEVVEILLKCLRFFFVASD
jgi:hypothetical protein